MCLLNACYDNKRKTMKLFTVYLYLLVLELELYRFPVDSGKTFVAKI